MIQIKISYVIPAGPASAKAFILSKKGLTETKTERFSDVSVIFETLSISKFLLNQWANHFITYLWRDLIYFYCIFISKNLDHHLDRYYRRLPLKRTICRGISHNLCAVHRDKRDPNTIQSSPNIVTRQELCAIYYWYYQLRFYFI